MTPLFRLNYDAMIGGRFVRPISSKQPLLSVYKIHQEIAVNDSFPKAINLSVSYSLRLLCKLLHATISDVFKNPIVPRSRFLPAFSVNSLPGRCESLSFLDYTISDITVKSFFLIIFNLFSKTRSQKITKLTFLFSIIFIPILSCLSKNHHLLSKARHRLLPIHIYILPFSIIKKERNFKVSLFFYRSSAKISHRSRLFTANSNKIVQ